MKTIEELKQASDDEILKMYDDAQVHTTDFQKQFSTNFSYASLISEIKNRGFVNGWYKPVDVKDVYVPLTKETGRLNLGMTPDTKTRYEKFLGDKDYNYMYTSAALNMFMDAYNAGEININITLGKRAGK